MAGPEIIDLDDPSLDSVPDIQCTGTHLIKRMPPAGPSRQAYLERMRSRTSMSQTNTQIRVNPSGKSQVRIVQVLTSDELTMIAFQGKPIWTIDLTTSEHDVSVSNQTFNKEQSHPN